jgi:hypothetical protein
MANVSLKPAAELVGAWQVLFYIAWRDGPST